MPPTTGIHDPGGVAVRLFACVLILALSASTVRAQPPPAATPTPPLQEFVQRYVAAVNAKDAAAMKQLLHPGTMACITPETAVFFDDAFQRRFRHTIPAGHRLSVGAIGGAEPLLFEDMLTYPVRPTHVVQIAFETNTRTGAVLMIQVVQENAGWQEVLPCPKPEALAKFREAREEQARYRAEAQRRAAAMPGKLRDELRQLLAEGRQLEAIQRYSAVTGANLTLARAVIRELIETQIGQ